MEKGSVKGCTWVISDTSVNTPTCTTVRDPLVAEDTCTIIEKMEECFIFQNVIIHYGLNLVVKAFPLNCCVLAVHK